MDISAITPKTPVQPGQDKNLAKVASEFEGMFLSQMVSYMFEGVKTDETFGGGHGEDMFRGMMVSEYGKIMAKAGGIGMADDIQKAMLKIQQQRTEG